MIVHTGRSLLDKGHTVRVQLSGLGNKTRNPKTGDMVQAWILADAIHPWQAVTDGTDTAVCGECPLRWAAKGSRRCYVAPAKAASSVWKAGRGAEVAEAPKLSKPLRIGAYGDPGAVPVKVWRKLVSLAPRHTAYTHQWRRRPSLKDIAMASVDSEVEARQAWSKGWRTFRSRRPDEPVLKGEIVCPASAEAGKRTTCAKCGLCNGKQGEGDRRANVVIVDHGATSTRKGRV